MRHASTMCLWHRVLLRKHVERGSGCVAVQEVSFGHRVRVRAHLRLSERNARLNRKLLRATLAQPNLTELTIADMLPHDLDADLVRVFQPFIRLCFRASTLRSPLFGSPHLLWKGIRTSQDGCMSA